MFRTCGYHTTDTPFSSTNKTDSHDITEIMLKVALNTIIITITNILITSGTLSYVYINNSYKIPTKYPSILPYKCPLNID
jgi:hypothetical protein